jgi:cation:H+ antiporter
MVTAVSSILGGLLLLTLGAEALVRGAASLARRAGLSPLVIGLTVLAYGTSAPELVVSLQAAIGGNPDIALGNVVGSNISNIGLILGGAALLSPIRVQAQVLRLDLPIMVGVSGLLLGLLWDEVIGRLNGVVLVLGAGAYTLIRVWGGGEEADPSVRSEFEDGVPDRLGWGWDALLGAGGLALLVLGARILVDGAVAIASGLGVPTVVIGLTVVAIGTSLPELATSLVAALRGHSDLALGTVVGSNIVNILGILGATACVEPIAASGLTVLDAGVLVGFAVLMLPLLRSGFRVARWEGGVLLGTYAAYVSWLVVGMA